VPLRQGAKLAARALRRPGADTRDVLRAAVGELRDAAAMQRLRLRAAAGSVLPPARRQR
jgi:hypothetical protein